MMEHYDLVWPQKFQIEARTSQASLPPGLPPELLHAKPKLFTWRGQPFQNELSLWH